MKAILSLFLAITTALGVPFGEETASVYEPCAATEEYWYKEAASFGDTLPVRSALLMEYSTGRVLYAQNENNRYPIASVTKIMSTLLVMEAIDEGKISLEDKITVSADAAKMGGSQVFLEENEEMTVNDLLKAMIVASANDATVAFACHLAGSESAFVSLMNERAKELGMENTVFRNCHGLNEEGHFSSAYDVALMTRELMSHERVFGYTKIWMDTIRGGAFGLANTNKLIRFYSGATGMKTGYTDLAKYCVSATAERDGMKLIAVIIGAESSDIRFECAKKLLDYGFASYCVYIPEYIPLGDLEVKNGKTGSVEIGYTPKEILLEKGKNKSIVSSVTLDGLKAPVAIGDTVGNVSWFADGECVLTLPVYAVTADEKITFADIFFNILKSIISFS